jgi:hypothetical protein
LAEGLITEIQRDAIDSKASVSNLLRKVKLAAAKLKLESVASWVDLELNGYPTRDVPEYRKFSGSVRYWNEYRGWQPLGGDAKLLDKLSEVTFGDSVASIERLVEGKSGSLLSQFPPAILEILSKGMGINVAQAGAEVATANAAGILDAVRTAVLNWAIEMERAGVHGEGLSFSPVEQEKAQTATHVFNIGSIGTMVGNLGVGISSGDITSAPLNVEKIRNLVAQINSQTEHLANEGVEATALISVLERIETHLAKLNESLLRKALGELKSILTDAAGGLVSTGALALLNQILGTGVPG